MTIIPGRRRKAIPPAEREFLDGYKPQTFPPLAVTVDVAILTVQEGELAVVLVRRGEHPYKDYWALPGGFLRESEGLDEAAARELAEETRLEPGAADLHLEQLGTYGDPERDPRMRVVTVAYLALVPKVPTPYAGGDAVDVRLWPVNRFVEKAPRLAFDHASILNDAIERACAKLEYTSLATAFLEEPFTLSELRRVYEAVWGVELDPANFRRKVLTTPGFVEPVGGNEARTSAGRPAQLYVAGVAATLEPPLSRASHEPSQLPESASRPAPVETRRGGEA
jgi:8-oxo-dGTP diphosphatase